MMMVVSVIMLFGMLQHQQQVATAVERAKQVTMTELNAIIGVSLSFLRLCYFSCYEKKLHFIDCGHCLTLLFFLLVYVSCPFGSYYEYIYKL